MQAEDADDAAAAATAEREAAEAAVANADDFDEQRGGGGGGEGGVADAKPSVDEARGALRPIERYAVRVRTSRRLFRFSALWPRPCSRCDPQSACSYRKRYDCVTVRACADAGGGVRRD